MRAVFNETEDSIQERQETRYISSMRLPPSQLMIVVDMLQDGSPFVVGLRCCRRRGRRRLTTSQVWKRRRKYIYTQANHCLSGYLDITKSIKPKVTSIRCRESFCLCLFIFDRSADRLGGKLVLVVVCGSGESPNRLDNND